MDFGTPMDLYSGLFGVMLLHSLNFFYGLIPNYGVAIILVTIALKIIFWPIQAKSIQSMKAMQKFQPLMNKLREKYKDDPQRLQHGDDEAVQGAQDQSVFRLSADARAIAGADRVLPRVAQRHRAARRAVLVDPRPVAARHDLCRDRRVCRSIRCRWR